MRKNVHLLMLLLIALLSGCKEKEAEREKVPTRVMTETVEATGMAGGQSYVGVVEENEGTAVSFTGMGAVRRVYVDEGQMVRRGQLIAEMDDTQARNALSAADAFRADFGGDVDDEGEVGLHTAGGGAVNGMGLLPAETVFAAEKHRTRVTGAFGQMDGIFAGLTGLELEGYEIHMGQTTGAAPIARLTDAVSGEKRADGGQSGNVYGSYVHGILDRPGVATAIIGALAAKKGVAPEMLGKASDAEHKQQQYDILAATMREHMDMKKVYEILEAGL